MYSDKRNPYVTRTTRFQIDPIAEDETFEVDRYVKKGKDTVIQYFVILRLYREVCDTYFSAECRLASIKI